MSPDNYYNQAGIVDKVRAVRGSNEEVKYLEATIRIDHGTEFESRYGGNVTSDLPIAIPVTSSVNPGDLVQVTFQFANPYGQRFAPALEASTDEDADDTEMELV